MRTLKLNPLLLLCAITFLLFFISCSKPVNSYPENSHTGIVHQVNAMDNDDAANNIDNDVFNIVMGYDKAEDNMPIALNSDNVSMDGYAASVVFPHKLTIDFGNGCTSPNGITKKGKIIITYFQPVSAPQAGTVSQTNFENFFIGDVQVGGELTINNITSPNAPYPVYEHSGLKIFTYPNGELKKYNGNRIFTQTKGAATPDPNDDEFYVTGNSGGTTNTDIYGNGKHVAAKSFLKL